MALADAASRPGKTRRVAVDLEQSSVPQPQPRPRTSTTTTTTTTCFSQAHRQGSPHMPPRVSKTGPACPSAGAVPEAAAQALRSKTAGPPRAPRMSVLSRSARRSPFEPCAASPFTSAGSAPNPFASPAVGPPPGPGSRLCAQNEPTLPPWWRPAAGLLPRPRARAN